MLKGRKLDHIGLACTDSLKNAAWYHDVLGFEEIGRFYNNGGWVCFLQSGTTVYEIYTEEGANGKIDHIAYTSDDIDEDYKEALKLGYKITTNGIESIPVFWAHGIRYFKIESACGEQIEFVMKIKE